MNLFLTILLCVTCCYAIKKNFILWMEQKMARNKEIPSKSQYIFCSLHNDNPDKIFVYVLKHSLYSKRLVLDSSMYYDLEYVEAFNHTRNVTLQHRFGTPVHSYDTWEVKFMYKGINYTNTPTFVCNITQEDKSFIVTRVNVEKNMFIVKLPKSKECIDDLVVDVSVED